MSRRSWHRSGMLAAALLCGIRLAAADKLELGETYSMEFSAQGPTENYFPLGSVKGTEADRIRTGLGFREEILCDYNWKDGTPLEMKDFNSESRGCFHMGSWGAHTFAFTLTTKDFGDVTYVLDEDGKLRNLYHVTLFHPNFRKFIVAYDGEVAKQYGARYGKDQLIMWSLDNEWQGSMDYQELVIDLYRKYLAEKFQTIEQLNRAWGSSFESFETIHPPKIPKKRISGAEAAEWLNWHRFQTENFSQVIAERLGSMHNSDPLHRPAGLKAVQGSIDFAYWTKRNLNDFSDLAPAIRPYSGGWIGCDIYGHGDTFQYEYNYLYNCIAPDDPADTSWHGVMGFETNNHGGPDWEFTGTFYRVIGNGMKGANFFTMGGVGNCWLEDPEVFGFIARDGKARPRYFALSSFVAMLQRSEAFWKNSAPAPGVVRVAMLNSNRDNLIQEDPESGIWSSNRNSRQALYRRFRNLGYWVDVLPYHKLTGSFLKQYPMLILCDAEMLTREEVDAIENYVRSGGRVLADLRAGALNIDGQPQTGLAEVFGVTYAADKDWEAETVTENGIRFFNFADNQANGAEALTGGMPGFINTYGDGKAILCSCELGSWRTPDEYITVDNRWGNYQNIDANVDADLLLAGLLEQLSMTPQYTVEAKEAPEAQRQIRVEMPYADAKGNVAITLGNTRETLVPGEISITLPLPEGCAEYGFYSPGQSYELIPVRRTVNEDQSSTFVLPYMNYGGTVTFFKDHAPMLGMTRMAVEGRTEGLPQIGPDETGTYQVQLAVNRDTEALELRNLAPENWKITPEVIQVPAMKAGEILSFPVTVTAPDYLRLKPDQIYSVLSEVYLNGERQGKIHQNFSVVFPPERMEKFSRLLSDNYEFPEGWAYRLTTGADYKIVKADGTPAKHDDVKAEKEPFFALTDGRYGWWTKVVKIEDVNAEIIFDLKDVYLIDEVQLYAWNDRDSFQVPDVEFSEEGDEFFTPVQTAADWKKAPRGGIWHRQMPVAPSAARYVKIKLGNEPRSLSEVQIWGRIRK